MLTGENTFVPIEIMQVHSIEHEINVYNVSIFKVIYEVKTLNPFKRYSVYEKELYSLEDMEKVLNS